MTKTNKFAIGSLILIGLLGAILLIVKFTAGLTSYETMGGPVAVFEGTPSKHGFLGVDFESKTRPLVIKGVTSGTGAADAGILCGDEIVAAGPAINPDYAALEHQLTQTSPGDSFPLTIRRAGVEQKLTVRLMSIQELVVLQHPLKPATMP